MRTDNEILDQTNELARQFYSLMGYEVKKAHRFDPLSGKKAPHPQEILCWNMAALAQLVLTDTELDDVISNLEE